MADTGTADIKKLTFERAIEELETIVKRLEEGKVPLEESVTIYERGEALKRRCEELLRRPRRGWRRSRWTPGKPTGTEPRHELAAFLSPNAARGAFTLFACKVEHSKRYFQRIG
jgi:exodeoxyribonuclease VII small subunit